MDIDEMRRRYREEKKQQSDNVFKDAIFHDLYVNQDKDASPSVHAHFEVTNHYKQDIVIMITTETRDYNDTYDYSGILERCEYSVVQEYENTLWKDWSHTLCWKNLKQDKTTLKTTFEVFDNKGNSIGSKSICYNVNHVVKWIDCEKFLLLDSDKLLLEK